ncbi:MFS transporter [Kitasatospora sp. NPDC008050]|uniref:MFS transporter n=1 Tax=Kitasatospora sp. NPDC008050 TaxID=3364021 RepID=UPI0036EB91C6
MAPRAWPAAPPAALPPARTTAPPTALTAPTVPTPPTPRLALCTAVVALGGLLFGFDTGVISGALLFLREQLGLSSFQQGTVISVLLLGAAAGALGSARPADRFGRKKVLVTVAATFTLGLLLATLATGFWTLLAARAVLGLAVGSASTVAPLYLTEVAPPRLRGRLVTVNQILLTVGILISYLVDFAFAGAANWRAMFAVGLIPSAAMLLGTFAIPETPAWLAQHSRPGTAAPANAGSRSTPGALSALGAPGTRAALLIGVTLAAVQQFGGINSIIYYAPSIMARAGMGAANSIGCSVAIGTVNVLMTIAAVPLIDRAGRRPLLLWSLSGMALSLIALGIALGPAPGRGGDLVALIAMAAYVGSFAIGLGPVFWVLAAELFPPESRARGASACALVNWAANFVVGQTFLPAADLVGERWVFWFFAAVSTAAIVFVLRRVPETKNRPLSDIHRSL